MNNDRIEVGARAMYEFVPAIVTGEAVPWEELPEAHRQALRNITDAVLAALPSEGWERGEQVGWMLDGEHLLGVEQVRGPIPREDRERWVPIFAARRVDGAAPPEPERTWRHADGSVRVDHMDARAGDYFGPASSTPTEVERLREALENLLVVTAFCTAPGNKVASVMAAKDAAHAALSGQQDTTECTDDDPLDDANGYSNTDLLFGGTGEPEAKG